jgi:hypothetical protein
MFFISKCLRDIHHPMHMIQWPCAILHTPHLLTRSHKAVVWFPYQLLEGSLSWMGFTRGRSAASVLCSVQTRTSCHPDASTLHRAVIVKEFHKGAETNNTIAIFVTLQSQGFIIAMSTRLQPNVSSDCELVQEELLTRASCVAKIPQGIQLCIVCET